MIFWQWYKLWNLGHTKFKQIKRQLQASGFDSEYPGQIADTLNNTS